MTMIIAILIIYLLYHALDNFLMDNSCAHNVDWYRMSADQHNHSKSELKRLYKQGYYNKR